MGYVVLGLDMVFLGGKWQIKKWCHSKGNEISRFAFGLRFGLGQSGSALRRGFFGTRERVPFQVRGRVNECISFTAGMDARLSGFAEVGTCSSRFAAGATCAPFDAAVWGMAGKKQWQEQGLIQDQ